MEHLTSDPIITFYMKMSSSSEAEEELPLYSETMLRLSFKEIFGPMRCIYPGELELYRKLLLFVYADNYPSVSDLAEIMNCFDANAIREYLDNHSIILAEWRVFLESHLYDIVFKRALNEMLYEYTIRYLSIYGEIDDYDMKAKAEEIQLFLRCNDRLPKQWFRSFKALLKNRMGQTQYEPYEKMTDADLNLLEIFHHVKPRLNILVIEAVWERLDGESSPNKKPKYEEITIDRVNTKSENSVGTEENDEDFDVDSEIPVVNESAERICELSGEDDSRHAAASGRYAENTVTSNIEISREPDAVELLQQVDILDSDAESEDALESNNNEGDDDDDDGDGASQSRGIIGYDTAISYLAALQAYAVVNGHFEAIGLLDEVDSILRQKEQ